eukprot:gene12122-3571_t
MCPTQDQCFVAFLNGKGAAAYITAPSAFTLYKIDQSDTKKNSCTLFPSFFVFSLVHSGRVRRQLLKNLDVETMMFLEEIQEWLSVPSFRKGTSKDLNTWYDQACKAASSVDYGANLILATNKKVMQNATEVLQRNMNDIPDVHIVTANQNQNQPRKRKR